MLSQHVNSPKLVRVVKSCSSASNKDVNLCFQYLSTKAKHYVKDQFMFGRIEESEVNFRIKFCLIHFRKDN